MNRKPGVQLLILSFLTIVVAGCGSSSKAPDSSSPTAPSQTKESLETPHLPEAKPVDTSRQGLKNLDQRYLPLQEAVRSGQGERIIDESSKILATNPSDPVALNSLSMFYYRRGKIGAARLLLNRAFEKNPPSAALHNNLGLIDLADGNQVGAIENFKKAIRLDDAHGEALGNLGSIYASGGDFLKAQPLLEQSYRLNRSNSAIGINYAVTLRAAKSYDKAASIYEDVLKQDSKNVNAAFNYAVLLINHLNRPKDGLVYVYKVKLLETERKDLLEKTNELEKKARSGIK